MLTYLDYAATTPVDGRVLKAMTPYFCDVFSNPSSKHTCGRQAEKAVEDSREKIAFFLGAQRSEDIIFTAGASEANNLAIKGIAECHDSPRHFITSSFEHKCVLNAMRDLEAWGHKVTYIKPQKTGVIDPQDVIDAMQDDTVLCSIMHVNNEIGTIQPIDDIATACKARGVLFHTDATQSFGKMPVNQYGLCDMISVSAHKFYGPKGIGCLYADGQIPLKCQIAGGSQESGLRAGTLNVPGIVGMATAAQIGHAEMDRESERIRRISDAFLEEIMQTVPNAFLQGDYEQKVPWIHNICFYDADAGLIRDQLGEREICVSRSSACAKSDDMSHVLKSIGTHQLLANGAIRFSFGKRSKIDKCIMAAKETACIVAGLRA